MAGGEKMGKRGISVQLGMGMHSPSALGTLNSATAATITNSLMEPPIDLSERQLDLSWIAEDVSIPYVYLRHAESSFPFTYSKSGFFP